MADLTPTTATNASALDGTERIPCTQGGLDRALTPAQVRTLIQTLLTELTVDNLKLDGNTLSSLNANGNITIDPNGTGAIFMPCGVNLKHVLVPETEGDSPIDVLSSSSGAVFTNTGAGATVIFVLPAAPALGDEFSFAVDAAHDLTVAASGTQVIKVGAAASTAGGTFTSSTSGSFLRIVYVAADLFIGTLSGTWTPA